MLLLEVQYFMKFFLVTVLHLSKILTGFEFSQVEFQHFAREGKRLACLQDIRKQIVQDYQELFKQQSGGVAFIDVSVHDNLGDNLLAQGVLELIRTFGRLPTIVCQDFQSRDKSVNQNQWGGWLEPYAIPKCNYTEVIEKVGNKGIILIQAGGNWGDLYYGVQENRLRYLQELKRNKCEQKQIKVIQMPQSIHYGNHTLAVKDAKVINSLGTWFTLLIRSPAYLPQAYKLYPQIQIHFSPDIAFLVPPQNALNQPKVDVYFLLRMGKESTDPDVSENRYEITEFVANQLEKRGLNCLIDFEWAYREQPYEMSSSSQASFFNVRYYVVMKQLSQGRVIVTDKLHGVILAMMMGKPCVWVDTKQGKTSKVVCAALELSEKCDKELVESYQVQNLEEAINKASEIAKKVVSERLQWKQQK